MILPRVDVEVPRGEKHVTIELYNLADDPLEEHNVAAEQADRVQAMEAAFQRWRASVVHSLNGGDYRGVPPLRRTGNSYRRGLRRDSGVGSLLMTKVIRKTLGAGRNKIGVRLRTKTAADPAKRR
jgi:hypothetical protein